jgi:hypothetical protein
VLLASNPAAAVAAIKAARLLVFMRALARLRPAMAFRPKASVTPACAANE